MACGGISYININAGVKLMRELIYILTLPHAVLTMTSIIYVLNCLILDHVLNSILFLVI